MQFAPESTDRQFGLQQRLSRDRAETHDVLGTQRYQLLFEVRRAVGDFVGLGIAIARRPTLDRVHDVVVIAAQLARLDHLRQQLARAANERASRSVLVRTGGFANEDEPRRHASFAEHGLRSTTRQHRAFRTGGNVGGQRFQKSLAVGRRQARSGVGSFGGRERGDRVGPSDRNWSRRRWWWRRRRRWRRRPLGDRFGGRGGARGGGFGRRFFLHGEPRSQPFGRFGPDPRQERHSGSVQVIGQRRGGGQDGVGIVKRFGVGHRGIVMVRWACLKPPRGRKLWGDAPSVFPVNSRL